MSELPRFEYEPGELDATILNVMAKFEEPMTRREITTAVHERMDYRGPLPVEEVMDSLFELDLIEHDVDSRRLRLTQSDSVS